MEPPYKKQKTTHDTPVNALSVSQDIAKSVPEIDPNEVETLELLGEGSFGLVYRGMCRGQEVAVKYLKQTIEDQKVLEDFKREVATMASFAHPNICLFMGACTQPGNFFIVQEFLTGGDVETLLREKNTQLSLYSRMLMAKEAANGMSWLHQNKPSFIHRDLKTANLLLDAHGHVKVCDFGLSQVRQNGQMLRDPQGKQKGTPLSMAPEVLLNREFNEKADVYSFGLVLWEFVSRTDPFPQHEEWEPFVKAVCGGERPKIPPNVIPELRDLINECWHATPERRPTFDEIVRRMDTIILSVAILDPLGRDFWLSCDADKLLHKIQWEDFLEKFLEYLDWPPDVETTEDEMEINRLTTLNSRCLKALLAKNDSVTLEEFGRVVAWFGPVGATQDDPDTNILDRVRTVLQTMYFHGDIDQEKATTLLSYQPIGSFVVRFSSGGGGVFTVSFVAEDERRATKKVEHSRFQRTDRGYLAKGTLYSTMDMALQQGFGLSLAMGVGGSPYSALFNDGGNDDVEDGYGEDTIPGLKGAWGS